jgi:hypothetical protein
VILTSFVPPDKTHSESQNEDVDIQIQANPSMMTGGNFTIEVFKVKKTVKIVYNILDSVRFSGLRIDTEMVNLTKNRGLLDRSDTAKSNAVMKHIGKLVEKYKACSRDSMSFDLKDDIAYSNLLDSMVLADKGVLENTTHNKNRIVLDGTHISYVIKAHNQSKIVYAHSPTAESHPILYAFTKRTLDIYREKKKDGILTKKYFSGF